jgi:pimeloyl-ACP methyl ester carboxylesterase
MAAVVMVGSVACSSDAGAPAADDGPPATGAPSTASNATSPSTVPDGAGSSPSDAAGAAEVPPVEHDQIAVGDLVFDVRLQGPADGELVVLLHGFPQTSAEWRHQQEALAQAGYRTVAPDQRGYSAGARPPAVDDYALTLLADDVLGIVDALGVDRFHVVGHDWGAAVVWVLGAVAPERLVTLTSVSIPHPAALTAAVSDPSGEQTGKFDYIDTFIAPGASERLATPEFFAAAMGDVVDEADRAEYLDVLGTPDAMDAAVNWYRANDPREVSGDLLPPTEVPTLFVYGTEDCCLSRDGADRTGDFVDAPYRYEVLDGIGHWLPEEAAGVLNGLLLEHLAQES